jgi:hypothetical protein
VESTIHTVNQTLVTVQATYLLPAEDEATDLRYREHCSERSKQCMEELTGWAFTVDGKQLECSEADWGLQAAEIQDAKLVVVTPACADSDIENKSEVEGNVAIIARGSCNYVEKVERAVAAGAVAVIVTNNDEENPDQIPDMGGGGAPEGGFQVPVLGVSYATGAVLSTATSVSRTLLHQGAPALLAAFGTAATAKLLQKQYGATGLQQGWEWFLEKMATVVEAGVSGGAGGNSHIELDKAAPAAAYSSAVFDEGKFTGDVRNLA